MGHHFVPQFYLKGFQVPDRPGMIWVFARTGIASCGSIKEVAQSSDFYDPDTEVDLARIVEAPANPVLAALREGGEIDEPERDSLVSYVATMIYRGPRKRIILPSLLRLVASAIQTQNSSCRCRRRGACTVAMPHTVPRRCCT